ncbi:CRISPR-associated endonuclease Cas2 [Effusibacillus lacus]|uniref:CRISPR-associated endoribonuclease Cas2 n=1 Tax=Effusibacillus lacus TaxID=1348429 RepID=A0A292YHI5_9BACL|nr:CRISPR-associated endonuclease Cas2 [Effusibacillus lacus]GAX88396.1 CRISPR-associated protein Cas2 [Effusibacillus lacus]
MQVLVIYDVENDRIRSKVANACKDYGLQRIQFSAFRGDLSANRMEELFFRLKKILGVDKGNIQMYPMCEKDLKQARGTES